jgi:CubicO group peptidase (beta-lactamase class C family)
MNFLIHPGAKWSLAFCLIILTFISSAFAQTRNVPTQIPNTPVGGILDRWIRAYRSGDFETIRQFMLTSYAKNVLDQASADTRASNLVASFRVNGAPRIFKIEKSTDYELVVVLQTELTEFWSRWTVKVSTDQPHMVTAITNVPIPPPPGAPDAAQLNDPQLAHWLDGYLSRLAAADVFSGSVVVAKNGRPFFQKAYGLASQSFKVSNRVDTKFNLGSMNKMFTAVAIAQLVEQGKLSFDDTIGKILPDYPNREVAEKVQIHHLLTHTSGLDDYFTPTFFDSSRERFRAVKDYLPLFVNQPLKFQPGERWSYSNAGFMLLGAVIEKVSGQDYFTYVREHIYKPAGMTDTDAFDLDHDTPNLAIGYTNQDTNGRFVPGPRSNNLYLHVIKGGPAGGGFSTAPDLLRFANALLANKLVGAKYTELLTSGKVDTGQRNEKYGYGFFCSTINGKRIVGHAGGFLGINSQLDIHLDTGYTIVVMSNYDPPIAQQIVIKIRQFIARP